VTNPSIIVIKRLITKTKRSLSLTKRLATDNNRPITKNRCPITEKKRSVTEKERLITKNKRLITKNNRLFTKNNRLITNNNRLFTKKSRLFTKKSRLLTKKSRLLTLDHRFLTSRTRFLVLCFAVLWTDGHAFRLSPGSDDTMTRDPIVEDRPERLMVRLLMGVVPIYSRYEPWRSGPIGLIDHEEGSGKILGRPTKSRDALRIDEDHVLTLVDPSMDLVVQRPEAMAGIDVRAMRTAVRRGRMPKDHLFLFGPTGWG
jgi:hypothetical protein